MMLWPRRMVIPILPEAVTGPLDDLYLRWVVLWYSRLYRHAVP